MVSGRERVRLKERGVPFVIHTGLDKLSGLLLEAEPQVPKPARPEVLVMAVAGLLQTVRAPRRPH